MKELLIRTGYSMTDKDVIQVRIVYSDGLSIKELEAVKGHIDDVISSKRGLEPKHASVHKESTKEGKTE